MRLAIAILLILVSAHPAGANPDVVIYTHGTDQPDADRIAALIAPTANSTSTLLEPDALAATLVGKEVFLLPDQSLSTAADLQATGASWASTLQAWVSQGGVVIQLDGYDNRHLLTNAGLINLTGSVAVTDQALLLSEPDDPLASDLSAGYFAEADTVGYTTTEVTAVVRNAAGSAVVLHKPYGKGSVVAIGHDYSVSNTAMEKILTNAVSLLPSSLGGLRVATTGQLRGEIYAGGPLAPASVTFNITNPTNTSQNYTVTAGQGWLSGLPASGSIPAGGSVAVTASLGNAALALAAGTYTSTVTVQNTSTTASKVYTAALKVKGVAALPFLEGFESGTLLPVWDATGTGDSTIAVTSDHDPFAGSRHAVLATSDSGRLCRNEMTLTADLSRAEGVVLSFSAKDFSLLSRSASGKEVQGRALKGGDRASSNPFVGGADTDALLVSPDGITWYEVMDFRTSLGQSYGNYQVDLDEAIGQYGLSYSNRFRIRFNHAGRNAIPADGLAFDSISLTASSNDALVVAPLGGADFVRHSAASYLPANRMFSVTNSGASVMNIGVTFDDGSLTATPNTFSLSGGASQTITIAPSTLANSLTEGIHETALRVRNLTTQVERVRQVRIGVGTKRITAFTGYTDKSAGGELENTRAAIGSLSGNFFWRQVDYTNELVDLLPQTDAVLFPDQDQGGPLFAIGQGMGSALQSWVENGGVFVQCSESTDWQIADGAGLLDIQSASDVSGALTKAVNGSDPIMAGFVPYTCAESSAAFVTPETSIAASTESGLPVVLNRRSGAGHAVAIGHDYSASTPEQDRILGNAIFALPSGENLSIESPDIELIAFEGIASSSHKPIDLRNLGSSSIGWEASRSEAWLTLSPESGTIPGGGVGSIAVSLSPSALSLPAGEHEATVTIVNVGTFAEQTRRVHLRVRKVAQIPFTDHFDGDALIPEWYLTGAGPFDAVITKQLENEIVKSRMGLASSAASAFARTEATVALDVRGREDIQLSFMARGLGEDASGPPPTPFVGNANFDGVAISHDEVTWFEVQDLRRSLTQSGFAAYEVDLDRALANTGIANDGLLFVRFNQFGNKMLGVGGIVIDDVTITAGQPNGLLLELGDLTFSGPAGGPFEPASKSIKLHNTSGVSKNWQAATGVAWLEVSPTSGVLANGVQVGLSLQLKPAASALPTGRYVANLTVQNTTDGVTRTRTVELFVGPRKLLVYAQYSDPFIEVPTALNSVSTLSPNFVVRSAADPAELIAQFDWADTLLIPEIATADDYTLRTIGEGLSGEFTQAMAEGKVIVVFSAQSGAGSGFSLLEGADLVPTVTTGVLSVGSALTIPNPGDPIASLVSAYSSTNRTVTVEGVTGSAVVLSNGKAVVLRVPVLNGALVLIGHSFKETVASQSRILSNSIFLDPPPGSDLGSGFLVK